MANQYTKSNDFVARYWNNVDVRGVDECWPWKGKPIRKNGYGRIRCAGTVKLAHRMAWELANGEVPAGLFVCHTCDNPICQNPRHLFVGSNHDNINDRHSKDRDAHNSFPGENNGFAKLTEAQVRQVREQTHIGGAELARMFGVNASCIYKIRKGENWSHV